MSDSIWKANSVRINEKGNLVIDAEPWYGNRKKWSGEMVFHIDDSDVKALEDDIAERKSKDHLVEIAKEELKHFLSEAKKEYHEYRKTLAKKLGVEENEIPSPWWNSFADPDTEIEILI
jgi:hypothetical protein